MFEIFLFCLHSYFLYVEEKLSGHEFEQALGDSEDREAWHAAIHGVAKSRA